MRTRRWKRYHRGNSSCNRTQTSVKTGRCPKRVAVCRRRNSGSVPLPTGNSSRLSDCPSIFTKQDNASPSGSMSELGCRQTRLNFWFDGGRILEGSSTVWKIFMRRFDPDPRLQFLQSVSASPPYPVVTVIAVLTRKHYCPLRRQALLWRYSMWLESPQRSL